jgi:hypothetical protein
MPEPEQFCHCGKPLHYRNECLRQAVQKLIDAQGPFVRVRVMNRTWLVQRHYIALHGIKAAELPSLGFEEVETTAR